MPRRKPQFVILQIAIKQVKPPFLHSPPPLLKVFLFHVYLKPVAETKRLSYDDGDLFIRRYETDVGSAYARGLYRLRINLSRDKGLVTVRPIRAPAEKMIGEIDSFHERRSFGTRFSVLFS